MELIKKVQMDTLALSELPKERQEIICSLKESLANGDMSTLDFGTEATRNISEFSAKMLETVKVKDMPEISDMLKSLMGELGKVDSKTLMDYKPGLFSRLFRVDDVKEYVQKFSNVNEVIVSICDKLIDATWQLKKDVELYEGYYKENFNYINDIDNYILAAKIREKELQAEIDEEVNAIDPSDRAEVIKLNLKQNNLSRLKSRIYDLSLNRESAIQNVEQIQIMEDGTLAIIEKIQTSIDLQIPTWRSQMVKAICLVRQRNGVDMQRAVTKTTNELIAINSKMFKESSLEIARAMQEGVIDIEVLEQSSKNTIETIQGVRQIVEDGQKKKDEAFKRLTVMNTDFNKALLEDKRRR